MSPSVVDKDKDDLRSKYVIWFSKVYKYMDSRATEQLTKGIVEAFEKSRRRIWHSSWPEQRKL